MALEHDPSDPDGADQREPDPDRDLVERAKAGDYGAFEALVRRHQGRVYAVALGLVKNAAEAEEVVQETFLSAFEHLEGFRGESQLSSWLYRVATNHGLMRLRKKKPEAIGGLEELEPRMIGTEGTTPFSPLALWARRPDEALEQGEITAAVDEALGRLADDDRAMLLLRAFDGLSHQEIADLLGSTVPAVKSRLHRTRLALRGFLAGKLEGITPASRGVP